MTRRVTIVSAFAPPHVGGVESLVGWMAAFLPSAGWDVKTVACVGEADLMWPVLGWMPLNQPLPLPRRSVAQSFRSLVRESDVVLIHNFFWPLSSLASELAHRERRPACTMIHSNTTSPAGSSGVVDMASQLHARTVGMRQLRQSRPIAGSYSAVNFIQRTFGMTAPVFALPLPELPEAPSEEHFRAEDPLRVVFAGRLVSLKAPDVVIAALVKVAAERPVLLEVFGDGPMRASLERSAPPWVTFRGSLPRGDVLDAVAQSHCFVNASTTDNALLSLLEAICLGVPAVSTDVGDASHYLSGDLSRCLVPVSDTDALARAIRGVALDWDRVRDLVMRRGSELRVEHSAAHGIESLDRMLRSVAAGRFPAGV